MRRRLLLILPGVAVAIVLWAVLGAGDRTDVVAAQLLGGPTRSCMSLSLLLRARTLSDGRRSPTPGIALSIVARGEQMQATWSGSTDETGHAEVRLDFPAPLRQDPWLRVERADSGRVLGEGSVSLDVPRWRLGARRSGGWLTGQRGGELSVRIAPGAGALAVPFDGPVVVQVLGPRDPSLPGADSEAALPALAGAEVSLELDGAELISPPPGAPARTGEGGTLTARLRPLEHAVSLRVVARHGERRGQWYGALPVVPGALALSLAGSQLTLRSPIARSHAFLSLVSEHERLGGAVIPLVADAEGGAEATFTLPPSWLARVLSEPTWAVLSSEDDKRSPGVVGWPLGAAFDVSAPPETFDVADQLLLDGEWLVLENDRQLRSARRRTAAQILAAVGVAMGALFWMEVRGRRPLAAARRNPGDDTLRLALAQRGWVVGVALLCLALGLGALGYFGMLAR